MPSPNHRAKAMMRLLDSIGAWAIKALQRVGADTGLTCFPVARRDDPRQLEGLVGLTDVLKGRARLLDAERRRERFLSLRLVLPRWGDDRSSVRRGAGRRPVRDGQPSTKKSK